MTDPASAHYLGDLGDLVALAAREARSRVERAPDGADRAFERGRLVAYHEVVSLMQQQAVAFGIDPAELALDGVDPDRDLL